MSAVLEEKNRHIFPRWRGFSSTVKLGELNSTTALERNDLRAVDSFLDRELEVLNACPSLWNSLDTLGTAIVAGRQSEIARLSDLVVQNANTPRFALAYLARVEATPELFPSDVLELVGPEASRSEIHKSRKRLHFNPHDAIEWVDLARAYTIAGVDDKGNRAIRIALNLAPENRFVLRSASRFYIHLGETEQAHRILARANPLKSDPWLLASEIAIADSMGKTSRNIRKAREHLAGDNSPKDISELASALGTIEGQGGNARIARKLLRQSFIGANENSIAQINWLQRKHLGEEIDTSEARPPLLHEATAWLNYYKADWDAARKESLLWLLDQPFASAPALLSSYVLSDILGEFEKAETILLAAIMANPDEAMLRNNLAFSQLNLNKIGIAEETLNAIKPEALSDHGNRLIQATFGMLAFRKGYPDVGRSLYMKCIDELASNRMDAARAAAHLLLEEIVANTDQVQKAIELVRRYPEETKEPDIAAVLARATTILTQGQSQS
jgi:Flp pilus assembly protein TadD